MSAHATARRSHRGSARCQSGIGLIELMVAMLIGLLVILGLTVVFINMKGASRAQGQLGDLQDKERLALSVLTTTIQSARYFPDPLSQTANSALPAAAALAALPAFGPGQGLTGSMASPGNPRSESITSRYVTAPNEVVMDCLGDINKTATNRIVLNTFSVDTSKKLLQCTVDGGTTWTTLVSGVKAMKVQYGTDLTRSGNVERYLDAAAVETAGAWTNVRTVRITVSFVNPYASKNAASVDPTIDWTQTIKLMNQS